LTKLGHSNQIKSNQIYFQQQYIQRQNNKYKDIQLLLLGEAHNQKGCLPVPPKK